MRVEDGRNVHAFSASNATSCQSWQSISAMCCNIDAYGASSQCKLLMHGTQPNFTTRLLRGWRLEQSLYCVTDARNEICASWRHQKDSSWPGIEDRGEEGGEDGHKQRGREEGEKGGREEGEEGQGKASSNSTGFPRISYAHWGPRTRVALSKKAVSPVPMHRQCSSCFHVR